MRNNEEIKRTNFRFPAYADDAGVKIQREEKRNLFSNDENWILTEESETPFYSKREPKTEIKDLRRSNRSTSSKAGHTIRQKEELKRHRSNLPDYSKRVEMEVTKTGKKQFFGDTPKQASYLVKEKAAEIVAPSVKRQYSGRSYFVPKYIPASIIPDEKETGVTESELLQSMEKSDNSYLLFDTEATPYQERKEGDPSVQKFASDRTAEGKEKKRKKRLERTLEGMIEQERDDVTEGNYFK